MTPLRFLTSSRLLQLAAWTLTVAMHAGALAQDATSDMRQWAKVVRQLEDQGKGQEAIPLAQKLLALQEADPDADVNSLTNAIWLLARAYELAGQYAQALPLYERDLKISEKALGPDHPDVADSLNNLAGLYRSMGQYAQALPLYKRSLKIREEALGPDHRDVAISLNNLADLHESMWQYAQALPLYQRSLKIKENVPDPDHRDVANSLNNLAGLYTSMGQYAQALPLYERSLKIREEALGPDHRDVATSLNDLAVLYESMGQYAKALPMFERSLKIREKAIGSDPLDVTISINNLARLYELMGQYAQAIPMFERSLKIREKVLGTDHPDVATSLNNLAGPLQATRQCAQALPLLQRALSIREKALGPGHPDIATSLNNLAGCYNDLGEHAPALHLFERDLQKNEMVLGRYHPAVAGSLSNLTALYVSMKQPERGIALGERAVSIANMAESPEILKQSAQALSAALWAAHRKDESIYWGKVSVDAMQGLRANSKGLQEGLQKGLLDKNREVYTQLADHLISMGRLAEAEHVMAMVKEEEYFEFVRRDIDPSHTKVDRNAAEDAAYQRSVLLTKDMITLVAHKRELEQKVEWTRDAQEKATYRAQIKVLEDQLRPLNERYQAFMAQLGQALRQGSDAGKTDQVVNAASMAQTVLDKLGAMTSKTAMLQYVVSDDRLHVIVSTATGVPQVISTEIKSDELYKKVHAMRAAVKDSRVDPLPTSRAMYELLIAPAQETLNKWHIEALMLNLDGVLRYVPFAALYGKATPQGPDQYLMQQYQLAVYTQASDLGFAGPQVQQWTVSALGVSKEHTGFSALDFVPDEINAVSATLPGSPKGLLDEQFNLEALRYGVPDARTTVVHIASHFKLTPGNDTQSYLLLGDGSHLSLADLSSTSNGIRFKGVDLLTLSACETGLGDDNRRAQGVEVEGLAVKAQKQGARGVMASLWSVADDSTSALMQRFYAMRQSSPGMTKAQALRQVQLEMLQGQIKPTTGGNKRGVSVVGGSKPVGQPYHADASRPYAHPFYWAPFILLGNWL